MTLRSALSLIYDAFTASVSLLDFITDVMVLFQYYNQERMTFFYISLSILIVAQLSYSTAFWFRFNNSFHTVWAVMLVFLCTLLIAPILSFVFYLIGNDDSKLYKDLARLFSGHANHTIARTPTPSTALREWAESKLMKHIGFIIEALIEAFPQSILQLIAIVYYNDGENYIAMFSILLSMISVSTKSFVLSVLVAYNWKSAFFNWISCVTDIFGLFFIVSFAFYDTNPFHLIQTVWLYSLFLTVAPLVVIGSLGWNIKQVRSLGGEYGWTILIEIIWLIGFCIALMLFSLSCFVYGAIALYFIGLHDRLHGSEEVYSELISFIKNAKPIRMVDTNIDFNFAVSKTQHQVIRACCVNYIYLKHKTRNRRMRTFGHDYELLQHLEHHSLVQKDRDYPYCEATFDGIKIASGCGIDKARKMSKLVSVYKQLRQELDGFLDGEWLHCSRWAIKHFLAPLYVFGRMVHMMFIVFVFCYLAFGYDVYIFIDIPLFQSVMFVCYLCLVLVWIIGLRSVLADQYYASFILPYQQYLPQVGVTLYWPSKAKEYCDSLISYPIARRYCTIRFGKDTANIIMEFCSTTPVPL
eukprot:76998_1